MNENNQNIDREAIKAALEILTERERHVVEQRFGLIDGCYRTIEEVARQFKVTPARIMEIENKALGKISAHQLTSNLANKNAPVNDAQKLADYAKRVLRLQNAQLSQAYYYQSLPFCIVDSIFSLGVRYGQVEKVVGSLAQVSKWQLFRKSGSGFPGTHHQKTVSDFLELFSAHQNPQDSLFNNRGYANPKKREGRILKARLAKQFAEVLKEEGVESFQDLHRHRDPEVLDIRLCALPGLGSGVGVRYFRMLAGDDDQVKPDRMIHRFIEKAIAKQVCNEVTVSLVQMACHLLKSEFPALTPRQLDHEIWKHQRNPHSKKSGGE